MTTTLNRSTSHLIERNIKLHRYLHSCANRDQHMRLTDSVKKVLAWISIVIPLAYAYTRHALRKKIFQALNSNDLSLANAFIPHLQSQQLYAKNGLTPLMHAAMLGNTEAVKLLLPQMTEEQISAQNAFGSTALFLATQKGHTQAASLLLQNMQTTHIATQNKNKQTALMWAAKKGLTDIIEPLLQSLTQSQIAAQDVDGNTALIAAIKSTDISNEARIIIVRSLLEVMTPEQISLQANNGTTALIEAASQGYTEIVRLLLDHMTPAQIAIQNNYKDTALIWASFKGHTEIVRLLLDHMTPAQIAIQDKHQDTALIWAAQNGHNAVVQLLVNKMTKDQISAQNNGGSTALTWAAEQGFTNIVQLLIDNMRVEDLGKCTNNTKYTALMFAAQKGHKDVVQLLLTKMTADQVAMKGNDEKTALILAAKNGHLAVAQLIVEKMNTEDTVWQDKDGIAALIAAAMQHHLEIVKLLAENLTATQIAKCTIDGVSLLAWASKNDHRALVELILNKMRAENNTTYIAVQDNKGYTALIWAASKGYTEIAQALLAQMTYDQISMQTSYGDTALIWAASKGYTEIVRLLLDRAPEQLQTSNASLKFAVENNHLDVVRLFTEKMSAEQLLNCTIKSNTLLTWASKNGHTEIVKLIIDKMIAADLMLHDDLHEALRYAINNGHTTVATILIDNSPPEWLIANINANPLITAVIKGDVEKVRMNITAKQKTFHDKYGFTALIWAILKGNTEAANLLIENMEPEQLEEQDRLGTTALIWAASKGNLSIVQALTAKMDAKLLVAENHSGDTALTLAAKSGARDVVQWLLNNMQPEQVKKTNRLGYTPLTWLISQNHEKAATLLAECMTPQQFGRNTALIWATDKQFTELVELLLKKLPDDLLFIHAKNSLKTALHYAADRKNIKIISLLLGRISPKQMLQKDWQGLTAFAEPYMSDQLIHELIQSLSLDTLNKLPQDQIRNSNDRKILDAAHILYKEFPKLRDKTFLEVVTHPDYIKRAPEIFSKYSNETLFNLLPPQLQENLSPQIKALYQPHSVNLNHIKPPTKALPPTPEVSLDNILMLFNKINFTDATAPNYFKEFDNHAEDFQNYPTLGEKKAQAKHGLIRLLNHLKNRDHFQGTPPANTPELEQYYDSLIYKIKCIIDYLEKSQDSQEIASTLVLLSSIGLHCGGRSMEEISLLWTQFTNANMDDLSLKGRILTALAELRTALLSSYTNLNSLNPHTQLFNRKIKIILGIETDVTGSFKDPYALEKEEEQIADKCAKVHEDYTPDAMRAKILEVMERDTNGTLKDLIIDFLKENIPIDFDPKTDERVPQWFKDTLEEQVSDEERMQGYLSIFCDLQAKYQPALMVHQALLNLDIYNLYIC